MSNKIKRLVLVIFFNSSLFLLLIIGIQNSSKRSKVNFLINESINLPISFIIGSSFILGSITGSIISLDFNSNKD